MSRKPRFDAAILVDMQEGYIDRFNSVHPKRTGISKETYENELEGLIERQEDFLRSAVKQGKDIYSVTAEGFGKIVPKLDEIIEQYQKQRFVKDPQNSTHEAFKKGMLWTLEDKKYTDIVTLGIHLDKCVADVNTILTKAGYKVWTPKTLVDDPEIFGVSSRDDSALHMTSYLDSHEELL